MPLGKIDGSSANASRRDNDGDNKGVSLTMVQARPWLVAFIPVSIRALKITCITSTAFKIKHKLIKGGNN